ncbi:unnamed protein product [Ectocarpus sp. 12 AP-2014]
MTPLRRAVRQPAALSVVYNNNAQRASSSSSSCSSSAVLQLRQHSTTKAQRPGAGRPTCPTCHVVLETRRDLQGMFVARCPKCSPAKWTPRNIEGASVSWVYKICIFFSKIISPNPSLPLSSCRAWSRRIGVFSLVVTRTHTRRLHVLDRATRKKSCVNLGMVSPRASPSSIGPGASHPGIGQVFPDSHRRSGPPPPPRSPPLTPPNPHTPHGSLERELQDGISQNFKLSSDSSQQARRGGAAAGGRTSWSAGRGGASGVRDAWNGRVGADGGRGGFASPFAGDGSSRQQYPGGFFKGGGGGGGGGGRIPARGCCGRRGRRRRQRGRRNRAGQTKGGGSAAQGNLREAFGARDRTAQREARLSCGDAQPLQANLRVPADGAAGAPQSSTRTTTSGLGADDE